MQVDHCFSKFSLIQESFRCPIFAGQKSIKYQAFKESWAVNLFQNLVRNSSDKSGEILIEVEPIVNYFLPEIFDSAFGSVLCLPCW